MTCAHCRGVENVFDAEAAARDLQDLKRHGPAKTTRWLIDRLAAEGVAGMTVMDIGGGLGVVGAGLLECGAKSVTLVEASSASLDLARTAAQAGLPDASMTFVHGNYVDLAEHLGSADIVCLDRVICCYPDMPGLVGQSSRHARRLFGAVYPRRVWWTRLGAWLINAGLWLSRSAFRVFVHSPETIERITSEAGFKPVFGRQTAVWRVQVFRREPTA
jgi:Methyltransferase domain